MTRAPRITAVQAAVAALKADLEAYEGLMAPDEYAVVVDLIGRIIDRERRRTARWERRKS
jgi:hypothetical protein